MADKESQDFLAALTKEGKEITINVKICDAEKATELLSTMNNDEKIGQFGVAVQSWGFWDIQKASSLRVNAMMDETERHYQEMHNLMNKRDQDYLDEVK